MILAHKVFSTGCDTVVVRMNRSGAEMEMACRPEQYLAALDSYRTGAMIQDAFPFLTATEREFLMTGMTAEEQENFYAGMEDADC